MHQGKKRLGSYETEDPEKKKVDQIVFKIEWANFAGENMESGYQSPKYHVMNKSLTIWTTYKVTSKVTHVLKTHISKNTFHFN
jgi:hypothetical protein